MDDGGARVARSASFHPTRAACSTHASNDGTCCAHASSNHGTTYGTYGTYYAYYARTDRACCTCANTGARAPSTRSFAGTGCADHC